MGGCGLWTTLIQVALQILGLVKNSKITVVSDGQQAVDEIHRQGGAGSFDMVFTDLQMPHKVPNNVSAWFVRLENMPGLPYDTCICEACATMSCL